MTEHRKLTVLDAGQNYWLRGGSDKVLLDIERLLTERGHDVIPFAMAQDKNLPTQWSGYFPPAVDFDNPGIGDIGRYLYNPQAAKALDRLLNEKPVDIAHLHIYYGQLTTSILKSLKRRGIPIVQTCHEYKLVCPVYTLYAHGEVCEKCEGHKFWQATVNRCNRGSLARSALSTIESYVSRWTGNIDHVDHFMAVSNFTRDKMIELGIPDTKVSTIYNFIEAEKYEPAKARGEYFLFFGRLDETKGVFTLLEAMREVPERELLFVGEGAARDGLEKRVTELGMTNVRFLGFKSGEELHSLVRGSICAVMPSRWYETFGLSAAEAMSQARPVIASKIGGLAEVVEDGVDGFHVPPNDVVALSKKLRWLADNPDKAAEMGRAGRENMLRKFTAQRHYDETMAVYDKVLAAKAS